jgi:hypothetical protein
MVALGRVVVVALVVQAQVRATVPLVLLTPTVAVVAVVLRVTMVLATLAAMVPSRGVVLAVATTQARTLLAAMVVADKSALPTRPLPPTLAPYGLSFPKVG